MKRVSSPLSEKSLKKLLQTYDNDDGASSVVDDTDSDPDYHPNVEEKSFLGKFNNVLIVIV